MRRTRRILAASSIIIILSASGFIFGQTKTEPPGLKDILNINVSADRQPLALSSDGKWAAVTMVRPNRAASSADAGASYFSRNGVSETTFGSDIWLVNTEMGETKNLTLEQGHSWGASWSPDGRLLAFYSDRDGLARLWIWSRERQTLRRLSEAVVRPYFGFEIPQWSPDGRQILVKLLPQGMTISEAAALLPQNPSSEQAKSSAAATAPSVTVFASDPKLLADSQAQTNQPKENNQAVSWTNKYLADLGLVSVETGELRRVADKVKALAYSFSPDGRRFLYTDMRLKVTQGRGSPVYSLVVVDFTKNQRQVFAADQLSGYGLGVSWDSKGQRIAYVETSGTLIIVGAKTPAAPLADWGELARFAPPAKTSLASDYHPPLWSADGNRLYLFTSDNLWEMNINGGQWRALAAPAGKRLVSVVANVESGRMWAEDIKSVTVVARDLRTQRIGFHRVSLGDGKTESLWEADISIGTDAPYFLDIAANGTVVFVAQDGATPEEIWTSKKELPSPRRISKLSAGFEKFKFGRSRLVEWKSATGEMLQGALLLPSDYQPGKRYPLILKIYGGSRLSANVNRFGLESGADNLQLLAARGYAVLVPDSPLRTGQPLGDLKATVLPGVDAVIEMGIADPERLGIFGHSYGGYSTLALLVQTNRFKAAAVSGSMSNLFSNYGEMRGDGSSASIGWAETGQGRMGGSPWEVQDRYLANSPFFFLDRVNTPLLIQHGAADRIVSAARAEETFIALRRLGKPVVFVRYEGEGHAPNSWKSANIEDYWQRIFQWFERYLKDTKISPIVEK